MFYHGSWIRTGWEVAQNSFLTYIFMSKYEISIEFDTEKGLYALNATKCNILYSWELLLLFRRKVIRFLKAKMDVQAAKKQTTTFSTCPDLIQQLFETILLTKFKASKVTVLLVFLKSQAKSSSRTPMGLLLNSLFWQFVYCPIYKV